MNDIVETIKDGRHAYVGPSGIEHFFEPGTSQEAVCRAAAQSYCKAIDFARLPVTQDEAGTIRLNGITFFPALISATVSHAEVVVAGPIFFHKGFPVYESRITAAVAHNWALRAGAKWPYVDLLETYLIHCRHEADAQSTVAQLRQTRPSIFRGKP